MSLSLRLQWLMEYRKHRLNWLACVLIVIFILVAGVIGSFLEGWDFVSSIHISALFIAPLVSLLLGTTSGIALRREDWKSCEELLPISPRKRVLTSYFCSLLVALTIFVLLTVALWGNTPLLPDFQNWLDPLGDLTNIPMSFLAIFCLYLHGAGFATTYWFKSTFLGGTFSFILAGGTLTILWWIYTWMTGWGLWTGTIENKYNLGLMYPVILLAILWGVIQTIWILPGWIEYRKKPGVMVSLAMMLCLSAGLVSILGVHLRILWVDANVLHPPYYMVNKHAKLAKTGQEGILLVTTSGKIMYMSPEGKRTLLYTSKSRPFINKHTFTPFDVFWQADGTIWFLTDEKLEPPRIARIYKGTTETPATPYSDFFPYDKSRMYFRNRGGEVLLYSEDNQSQRLFSPIPKGDQGPDWQPVSKSLANHMVEPLVESGDVARLTNNGHGLSQTLPSGKVKTWVLPARATAPNARDYRDFSWNNTKSSDDLVFPCGQIDGQQVFAVNLHLGQGNYQLALCYPDGSIERPWPGTREKVWRLVVGMGGFLIQGGNNMCLISSEGKPITRVLGNNETSRQVRVEFPRGSKKIRTFFRLQEGAAWFGFKESLVKVDLSTGKVLQQTYLRKGKDDVSFYWGGLNKNKNGVYFTRNEGLFRVNWDGSITDFGSNRVQ